MTEDLHKKNASLMFQKAEEEVTEEERKVAKAAMYLFQYKERGIKSIDSRTEVWFGEQSKEVMDKHNMFLEMHYRALACHCECLGMNAENMWAACLNYQVPYGEAAYRRVVEKWELTDEKGEPAI